MSEKTVAVDINTGSNAMAIQTVPTLPRAWGNPLACATIKAVPEDFRVEEILGFDFTGEGEHLWLFIEKNSLNTMDVVDRLSAAFSLHPRDIGYSGLKDKQAVTRQWFSVPARSAEALDDADFSLGEGVTLLQQQRHIRKLKHSSHKANAFVINCRLDQAVSEAEKAQWQHRLTQIARNGVPNYFGEQRFGIEYRNLERALAWFSGQRKIKNRNQKSYSLSAARSYLFNLLLAKRVELGCWDRYLPGDVLGLAGSRSIFLPETVDPVLVQRLLSGDVHPTGPMWGKGPLPGAHDSQAVALEQQVASGLILITKGLEQAGLSQERRKLRQIPQAFDWQWLAPDQLQLAFQLEPGAFATVVVRELVSIAGEQQAL